MTQEDKELLLRDLCARLPYGVKLRFVENLVVKKVAHTITMNNIYLEHIINGDADIKPYLRSISSMTEEEEVELEKVDEQSSRIFFDDLHNRAENEGRQNLKGFLPDYLTLDWLNAHHFDYRGLINKDLAIEAPKDMYKSFINKTESIELNH